jgi:GGDEF domain-containing protein
MAAASFGRVWRSNRIEKRVSDPALTEDVSSLEHLVEKADDELYRAKRAGKNRVAAVGRR